MKTPEAVKVLTQALNDDMDYRRSWHANISIAFQDEFARNSMKSDIEKRNIRDVANRAADHFLNQLCDCHHTTTTKY